jgi:hypothetical protein
MVTMTRRGVCWSPASLFFFYPPVPNPDTGRLLVDVRDKTGKYSLPPRVLAAMVVSISTILSVGTVPLLGAGVVFRQPVLSMSVYVARYRLTFAERTSQKSRGVNSHRAPTKSRRKVPPPSLLQQSATLPPL